MSSEPTLPGSASIPMARSPTRDLPFASDFGTGYSSLSYLQRFPFDKIKIDRCFINDIAEQGGSSIVQAVVNLAAARHMTTIAEGVETTEQRDLLHSLGCTEMQGYLFSAAIPPAQVRHLLTSRDKAAA
jgi:EAL domain-containing protein (putative c-di-GMP-specific phosphodiesterase class I)